MADEVREQLVIEARLQDLITSEAARVTQSLKDLGKSVEELSRKGSQTKVGEGLTKSVPEIKRVGGELVVLRERASDVFHELANGGEVSAQSLGKLAEAAAGSGGALLRIGGTVAGVAAVGLALDKATEAAEAFDKSLHGIILRVDSSTSSVDEIASAIKSLSDESGISTEKLAAGGAEVLRIFDRNGKSAVQILQEVSRTAKIAGQDEAATFAQVSAVLDGYKLRAADARDVSEELFAAALEGKANFGDVANTMARLAPLAKSLGFDFRQTAAVLVAMAGDAGGVNEAGSALHNLFGRLLSDKQLQGRLQAVGSGFDVDARSGNSLISVLRGLQEATSGSQSELASMLGGTRGAAAALALASADSDKLARAFSALAGSANEVDKTVRNLENLPEEKWDRLKNKVSNFLVELGHVPKAVKDAFTDALVSDIPAPSLGENFAASLRNALEQARAAVSAGDESGLKRWIEEYELLAEAAQAAGVEQEAGVKSLGQLSGAVKDTFDDSVRLTRLASGELEVYIEKVHRASQVKVSPEIEAKGAELLLAIQARLQTGLEQEAAQHEAIYAKLQKEISGYEDAGLNVARLRDAVQKLREVESQRTDSARQRELIAIDQQMIGQRQKLLEVEQQRARARGDFDQAESIGEQVLAERTRAQATADALAISSLEDQRRLYPQLAQAIDGVIGKIRERQYVEGAQARDAMDKANRDARRGPSDFLQALQDKTLQGYDAELRAIERNRDASLRAISDRLDLSTEERDKAVANVEAIATAERGRLDAGRANKMADSERELQALRSESLVGLQRELAQIELNRDAAVARAQQEAALDADKAKTLQQRILLLDGEAARNSEAAQLAARTELLRMEADLTARVAMSRDEQLQALLQMRDLDRQRLITLAREKGATDDQLDQLERLFDLETKQQAKALSQGFREGMDTALREYADSAKRMAEAGESVIRSFHDEGARSLSDAVKGNLSGKDALRQFGQNVLGNAIDQQSSLIFDSLTTSIFGAGKQIEQAGQNAAGGVQNAGGGLTGALGSLAGGIGGIGDLLLKSLASLFGGGGGGVSGVPTFLLPQAEGGAWNGTLLPTRAAAGGVFKRRTLLEVAEIAGRQEAVVPMHRGSIVADMMSGGPRVRVAGADIPLSIRGGRGGGGSVVNIAPTANVSLTVHALDPRGAADAVMAQMPQIQKAIAAALVRGSDRQLRDAVQIAAR